MPQNTDSLAPHSDDRHLGSPASEGDGALRGRLSQAVSNLVVHIYHEQVGRGPTKARTLLAGNLVVVTLEDTLTRAERTLFAAGETEAVIDLRRKLHRAMSARLCAGIGELTGTAVTAMLADISCEPDVSVHTFVLDQQMKPSQHSDHDRNGALSHGDGSVPQSPELQ